MTFVCHVVTLDIFTLTYIVNRYFMTFNESYVVIEYMINLYTYPYS